jgi:hypothetical protein
MAETMDTPTTLIVASGDVAGLLAMANLERRQGLAASAVGEAGFVMPALWPSKQSTRRAAALRHQAEGYGLQLIEPSISSDALQTVNAHDASTIRLVEACAAAKSKGASSVVWAVSSGRDGSHQAGADRAGVFTLQAMMIERVGSLDVMADHGSTDASTRAGTASAVVRVEAPYADFSDRQLAELVIELDLPVWTCWWWGATNDDQHAWSERQHWTSLLRELGWLGKPQSEPAATAATP